ncbi:antibiotic biosynthesis monooxygenase [Sphaerisporangium album]|uniref:Antibiotic biosynthesis monooxygenase n=1 Tax=Sphaerisporangium album TaxID=509200 RepID=A0A367FQY2_9ACTN|nr:antibiotic biosynthesis monooxygenase [Sphaerisporangium album]RCG32100.1 antibiotic biosynthesis monooxygenase [Sphaerisporangium album]
MISVGLLVRVHARPGREHDVEDFLRDGLALIEDEEQCTAWVALRINCTTFGVFNAFGEECGRRAHLAGRLAEALLDRSDELFTRPPTIERVEVLAAKLPGEREPTSAVGSGDF